MSAMRLALLLAFVLSAVPGWAADWIAYVAFDIPQTRAIFQELERRFASTRKPAGIDMRFVPVPRDVDEEMDAIMQRTVAAQPRIIVTVATKLAQSAKRTTQQIPIVFASVADPVREGLVASLARPGGNATGFTYDVLVEGKQLELILEIAPRARTIGVLEDGHWLGERVTDATVADFERKLGRKIEVFRETDKRRFISVAESPAGRRVDAWLVPISNAAGEQREELVATFNRIRKPVVFGRGFFVTSGGLAAYQEVIPDPVGLWLEAIQAILGGTPPGEIPVQRPMQFELSLNAATAKSIGVELPPSLLRRADRVVTSGARR